MITRFLKSVGQVIYSVVVGGLIIAPAIAGYAARFTVVQSSGFAVGVYGITLTVYMSAQMLFAHLNRRRYDAPRPRCSAIPGVVISAVGYREDPDLFRGCLQSLKVAASHCRRVLVVIDGNEPPDLGMEQVFRQVFGDQGLCLRTEILPSSLELRDTHELDEAVLNSDKKYICVVQPHLGKRHALYSAARWAVLDPEVGAVFLTDSDTEVDPDAILFLLDCLESDPTNGAVTGQCLISNRHDSVISFMSSMRYWFAGNLERAAQSYFGSVSCISGPIGLYRTKALDPILRAWITQKFFGSEATYGDDRHLTNQVLISGYKTRFTHKAVCHTETPATLTRWMRQQIRWNKSFVRELWWAVRAFPVQSFWFAAETVYQATYKALLAFSIVTSLFVSREVHLGLFLCTIFVVSSVRALYGILRGQLVHGLYPLYSVLYIFFLIPANFYAYLSLWDTRWGTSVRDKRLVKTDWVDLAHTCSQLLVVVAWNVSLITGFALRLYRFVHEEKSFASFDFLGIVVPLSLCCAMAGLVVLVLAVRRGRLTPPDGPS